MSMEFFDQGADQRFSVQVNSVFGLDQCDDLGDMEGFLGPSEYVYCHCHIRHTFMSGEFTLFGFLGLELPNGTKLG